MEEYITRAEFEAFKKQMEQRQTEEMKAINVNIGSRDVLDQLQVIEQKQDKISTDVDELKIDAKAYTGDAAIFKNKVEHVESDVSTIKTDIEQVKTIQNGHSKFFEEHGKRLSQMATKDELSAMETRIIESVKQLMQQKPGE